MNERSSPENHSGILIIFTDSLSDFFFLKNARKNLREKKNQGCKRLTCYLVSGFCRETSALSQLLWLSRKTWLRARCRQTIREVSSSTSAPSQLAAGSNKMVLPKNTALLCKMLPFSFILSSQRNLFLHKKQKYLSLKLLEEIICIFLASTVDYMLICIMLLSLALQQDTTI